jgi:hypothetical protein
VGSKAVEGTSIRRKPHPFAGRWRKRIFGLFGATWRRLQPPHSLWVGDPGAREMFEEGSSPHGESLARALPTRAIQHGAKASRGERGSLVIGVPPGHVLRNGSGSSMA